MEWVAIIVGCLFAMNIGASGAAATMGVAYGSGSIQKRYIALILCSIGIILGAVIGGEKVIKTIGSGLMRQEDLSAPIVMIILASATLTLLFSNLLGIPLSTSEVTVGSVVGVGIAFQSVYLLPLLTIISLWVIVPVIAYIVTVLIQKGMNAYIAHTRFAKAKILPYILILTGFLEAFSAGMNNIANAVGPLVGAHLLAESTGKWLGGFFVALGVLVLGAKVLETNGKRITKFSTLEGINISATGATLVILASLFGIPIPMTQITTSSILGIGFVNEGRQVFKKEVVKRLVKIWIVSPLVSLIVSYTVVQAFVFSNWYSFIIVIIVFVATIVFISLMTSFLKPSKQMSLGRNE
ncbi:inorganic phosphate transporter [Bacillus sp. FJAT-47783]|uniref:inorganic phosphate transporter n=1 Tax=Bacillus sp. FJAT-47783 TaxID=2922712 RepID=UPI001FABD024|nr:inorganic phosphate transporter [Bacillus sp. FJAT-47783]